MTVKQAATRLEISAATVYALVSAGRLRCYRVGLGRGSIRISDDHLAEFLRGAEMGSALTPKLVSAPAPPPPRHVKLRHLNLD